MTTAHGVSPTPIGSAGHATAGATTNSKLTFHLDHSVGSLHYTAVRLRRWLHIKHKTRRRKGGTYPLSHPYEHFRLVRLSRLGHDVSWVEA